MRHCFLADGAGLSIMPIERYPDHPVRVPGEHPYEIPEYDHGNIPFPFSNDECPAPLLNLLQSRAFTPEYEAASNPTAIVIGESSLAASLPYMCEKTIIVIDISRDMCQFMHHYVQSLRTAPTREEWLRVLFARTPKDLGEQMKGMALAQAKDWYSHGYVHPFLNDAAFLQSQAIANQEDREIIAWRGDIMAAEDMGNLGTLLRQTESTVTFMNLTSVLPYVSMSSPEACADLFRPLPMTTSAPILTTSLGDLLENPLVQTGPFFGLSDLANPGGVTEDCPLGRITMHRPPSSAP